jgi:hypothetical protein
MNDCHFNYITNLEKEIVVEPFFILPLKFINCPIIPIKHWFFKVYFILELKYGLFGMLYPPNLSPLSLQLALPCLGFIFYLLPLFWPTFGQKAKLLDHNILVHLEHHLGWYQNMCNRGV